MNGLDSLHCLATSCTYLDNAASSPLLPELADAFASIHAACFANPSADHKLGYETARLLDRQAGDLLHLLNIPADEAEVIWTSGGTEANNLAIRGTVEQPDAFHAITSATEHASVARTFQALAEQGARIAQVPVQADGSLRLDWLQEILGPETDLVSVCLVQNETGARQDLSAVRQLMRELAPQARLHTDAVQACCKVPIPWREAALDFVSLSAHKVHGPGGVGALVVRRGVELVPLVHGGGQQRNRRSGSLDAMGICGLVEAVRHLDAQQDEVQQRVQDLHQRLWDGLAELRDRRGKPLTVEQISPSDGSPFILAFSLPGYQGAVVARILGEAGVIVGRGSACAAESKKPSAVLAAMGLSGDVAFGTLRVSFGAQNTDADVDHFLAALQEAVHSY